VAEGISVLLNHRAKQFLVEDGERILVVEHAGGDLRIPFDAVLVAVGRTANLTGYGLEELGIPTGRTVETNEFLQTRYPNIYAAGDVAGPFQFTHTAAHQAWYAAVNALFAPFKKFKADYAVIPWSTFVEPEVARVGLNEQEAREKGIPCEVSVYHLDDLDRAIADGEAHGFIKVLTVPGKDRILGVTIVGEHAGDLIAEYVLAMKQGIGLNKILGTIHIYPTLAEANKYVAGVWKKAHAPQQPAGLGRTFPRLAQGVITMLKVKSLLVVCLLSLLSSWALAYDHTHRDWSTLLAQHVRLTADGKASRVDYAGMAADRAALNRYLASLSAVSAQEYAGWPKPQRLAFLINAYNAFTIDLVLSRYPDLKSIKDLGSTFRSPWKKEVHSPARAGAQPGRHRARSDPGTGRL
jgi:hypothetical protein